MGALGDLKTLVFKGFIETTAVIKVQDPGHPNVVPPVPATEREFKFLLRTLTMLEEADALEKAGFDKLPTREVEGTGGKLEVNLTGAQFSRYIFGVLCVAIRKVNDEEVTVADVEDFLRVAPSEILTNLWDEYTKLNIKTAAAGAELKNS